MRYHLFWLLQALPAPPHFQLRSPATAAVPGSVWTQPPCAAAWLQARPCGALRRSVALRSARAAPWLRHGFTQDPSTGIIGLCRPRSYDIAVRLGSPVLGLAKCGGTNKYCQ